VVLKQLYNKDLLYKGYTIQPYSPKAGTGLSSHELNQPGTYRDVSDTTVVAQFKVKNFQKKHQRKSESRISNLNLSILAWTTTPWTLPSNTALAVGRDIEYVLVKPSINILLSRLILFWLVRYWKNNSGKNL
jgi:isoleucyl-tRNA synthetase